MEYKFAQRLKELRLENKLSTMKLGKLIGVSDVSICRWENKVHDVKGEELVKLAQVFNVSTDYLLGLED
ncbi:MAG: helix-turn-helix transcriptional regulator [Clostridia bacterium]|nr:helix-turn-helix transcriptional regulator [Clostridia bacterium]